MLRKGDWIQTLVTQKVLVERPLRPYFKSGVVVVCDSETNPGKVVRLGKEHYTLRLIANEAGVLIASPDTRMQKKLCLDANRIIVEPLLRAKEDGFKNLVLCVNPHSIAGPMLEMSTIDLVDHLMRAREYLASLQTGVSISCVVHTPLMADSTYKNYLVSPPKWSQFYQLYETEVLKRRDDPDEPRVSELIT